MFNKNIKLILAIGTLAYAVYQFTEGFIGNGVMLVLLAGIFTLCGLFAPSDVKVTTVFWTSLLTAVFGFTTEWLQKSEAATLGNSQ